ncbi:MAG: hypothetical protein BWY27_01119 [Bacteroidetes bacterium ADurb.Bin234]|nr:MAG: hypothetical protein BWY27_01119 [Bacteroidetes bacterium ADurb.Bin234]
MTESNKIYLSQLEDKFTGASSLIGLAGTVGGAVSSIVQNKKNQKIAEKQAEADRLARLQLEAQRIEKKEKMQKIYFFSAMALIVVIVAIVLISKYKKS